MSGSVKIRIQRRIKPVLVKSSQAMQIQTPRQGPPGRAGIDGIDGIDGASAASFEFTQSSTASTWTINHNLGIRPSVMLFTTGGVQMDAEVVHTSLNQCLVYFVVATAGSARLN